METITMNDDFQELVIEGFNVFTSSILFLYAQSGLTGEAAVEMQERIEALRASFSGVQQANFSVNPPTEPVTEPV